MAKLCGVAQGMAESLFDELRDTVAKAVETCLVGLPKGFPDELARPITDGLKGRLREE